MAKSKNKKRNRQSSNAPVPLNAGDSSDSGELKSQPTNSESTPCNKLHWSSSHFTYSILNINTCVFQFLNILALMSKKQST